MTIAHGATGAVVGTTNTQTLTNKTLTSPTINGATIGTATIATSDITVGAGKTLDVSAGTLTLADNQISGDKVEGGTIAAITITALASTTITASKAVDITVANTVNDVGLTVTQNDTTSNPRAMEITNTGTGQGLFISQTGDAEAIYIDIDTDHDDPAFYVASDSNTNVSLIRARASAVGTNYFMRNLASANTAGPVVHINQDSDSDDQAALLLGQDSDAVTFEIDSEATSATAIDVDTQNTSGDLIALAVNGAEKFAVDYTGEITSAAGATLAGTLALGANSITMTGSIAATANRVTKGWFTDLECTNAIAADITGDSATCSGLAASATLAATITAADESADTECFVGFFTAATGDMAIKTGTNLTFNSSSGVLTATGFAGALTGNVTGDCSGSSGSCTGESATVATITGLAPDTQNTYSRTQYLIPYASSTTAWGQIAIGTDGQVLTSGGAGVAPSFEDAAGGGASKFKIGLLPAGANLTGQSTEPELSQVHGTNFDYDELLFDKDSDEYCYYVIPGCMTKDYAGGNFTIKIRWKGILTTGDVVWSVQLLGRTTSEAFDSTLEAADTFTACNVGGTTLHMVEASKTITAAAAKLTAGDTWILKVMRDVSGDDLAEDAHLIEVGITED